MISVLKGISAILNNSTGLTQYVGDKIYALNIPDNTETPVVCYERVSLSPSYTKDCYVGYDDITVAIHVLSRTYSESVDIAEEIRKSLEGKQGTYNNITFKSILLDSVEESYQDEIYSQSLIFKIK